MFNWVKSLFTKKEKYPYFCPQPKTAERNNCNYLGFSCDSGYGNKCLMPYHGCMIQKLKKDK